MIVREFLDNDLVRSYSDQHVYIHGGFPEGDYEESVDPVSANRVFVETDVPIPIIIEDPIEDMTRALEILGVSST